MKIAVAGAGIIGACTAWAAAKQGHSVTLFEQDTAMAHTSRSSSKLLHGGLRYLETGQFALVKKALHARRFWLKHAPDLCRPLELLFPIYARRGRPKWQVGIGTRLYDFLAAGSGFPYSAWLGKAETLARCPTLLSDGLKGAFSFYDAQMDDYALGQRVVEQCRRLGVSVAEHHKIESFGQLAEFERIANAAGPWAMALRSLQGGTPAYAIDWVRGSHIFIDRFQPQALMLPVPQEKRIFFVLPYQGKTLIGTTEVRQSHPDAQRPSETETAYLLAAYNAYHSEKLTANDISGSFSGVRPLIKSAADPSNATREWAFERVGNVLHIYGGKWTTAQLQGEAALQELLK
ncbi:MULTISPECIES: glycerol-3-phosphate dehydrogenase/oxidase [Neisseria]|uniref:FAD dependent oxidoreductase family protein n=1 Tax=Neisseria musculi TaxID=1815583 RepID=A0A7H1MEQ7_9NEIS|nr:MULTISPECIES: FAD-dependent oxidoreductase [Neisseria]MBF0803987.1 FAD-dependent oxidoreductase [Neisseria sp. 19428wB4_WF04]QNT60122.1 FAD dependent oxidoreductase family protein [Neisseria musculi]TFU43258.1 FAD-dependent oxidoreductase [Neisseria sp. WF04]